MAHSYRILWIVVYAPLVVLTACIGPEKATLSSVLRPGALQHAQPYVHVMPAIVRNDSTDPVEAPDAGTITRMIRMEIASRNLVDLISSDTLSTDTPTIFAKTRNDEMSAVKTNGAIILPTMKYTRSFARQKDAVLLLQLVDPRTDSVLAYSVHDVAKGDRIATNYMSTNITTDAIRLAVDGLEKTLRKAGWGKSK